MIPAGGVHLWEIDLDAFQAEENLAADELERAQGFRFAQHRKRFNAGRSALRSILGKYLERSANDIQFSYGPAGKPFLPESGLEFNLAHSAHRAVLALTTTSRIGADIEEVREIDDMPTVATFSFSPGEFQRWHGLPANERMRAFYRCWALKEAYLKAIGEGIAQRLQKFEVAFEPGAEPQILSGAEGLWSLVLIEEPGFTIAVAREGREARIERFTA